MRVVITGGTGLIGTALAESLAKDGHEVILLSRSSRVSTDLPADIRVGKWDGCSAQGWGHLADGADAIVNLAGENLSAGRWTDERKRAILDSRVNAGRAVVEAVQQAAKKPRMVVQPSGVGYYGTSETATFTEPDRPADDFLGKVSQAWEASTEAVEALGVRRVVMRLGVVLSPRSGALPRMLLPFKLFAGGPLGSGRQWMSWVHIEDVVRAIRFFIDNPEAKGVFNVSASPLTNKQFAQTAGRIMRRPAFFAVPAFIIRLVFGEMSIVVLEGQRVSSMRLQEMGFQFHYPDVESALKNLVGKSKA